MLLGGYTVLLRRIIIMMVLLCQISPAEQCRRFKYNIEDGDSATCALCHSSVTYDTHFEVTLAIVGVVGKKLYCLFAPVSVHDVL